MKSLFLSACFATFLISIPAQGGENLVKNGDFEDGEGPEFFNTPGWYNRGGGSNQGAPARSDSRTSSVITGSYSASVNDRYITADEKFGPTAHSQKTDYTIQEGDAFSLTYEWRPADEFWQRTNDTIRFVLYATSNDKVAGPVVWSSELTADFFKGKPENVVQVSQNTEPVTPEAVGHNLFVMFYGIDTVNGGLDGTPHWARVDNIQVSVLPKDSPE